MRFQALRLVAIRPGHHDVGRVALFQTVPFLVAEDVEVQRVKHLEVALNLGRLLFMLGRRGCGLLCRRLRKGEPGGGRCCGGCWCPGPNAVRSDRPCASVTAVVVLDTPPLKLPMLIVTASACALVSAALTDAAKAGKDSVVIISADGAAPHQSVITVLEAARRSGLKQITFAAQSQASSGAK